MSDHAIPPLSLPSGITLRHAVSPVELHACFPVIAELRPYLKTPADWIERATAMRPAGYRVLAVWEGESVSAVAGYRVMENLIHGRFLYVDDLVTLQSRRGSGLGATLLNALSAIGVAERCNRLVLDTAAANTNARRFYQREGLRDVVIGFVKPLEVVS